MTAAILAVMFKVLLFVVFIVFLGITLFGVIDLAAVQRSAPKPPKDAVGPGAGLDRQEHRRRVRRAVPCMVVGTAGFMIAFVAFSLV